MNNYVLLLLMNVGLVSAAQLLLKIGSVRLSSDGVWGTLWNAVTDPYIFFGTASYVLSLGLWIYLLSKIKLSIAYPLMSLSYVVVMIFSVLFLSEAVKGMQWVGVLLIVMGTSAIFVFK